MDPSDPGSAFTLDASWINAEFTRALKEKMGQGLQFSTRDAQDDEIHSAFFCECQDEVRSHLGWFKISARILDGNSDGMRELFKGLDAEMMEHVATNLLSKVIDDFIHRVHEELAWRGALFYPPIEELAPEERKILHAHYKAQSLIFTCREVTVMLELIQYI